MITQHLAAHTAAVHPLDLAALSCVELVDLLRQAANATAAGPDWYLTSVPPGAAILGNSPKVLVRVEPMVLDSPREVHCTLRWQTMRTALPCRGTLQLRAVATALIPHASSELSLDELRARPHTLRRNDTRRRQDTAHGFLRSLAHRIERDLAHS